jgi:hypothetical protein
MKLIFDHINGFGKMAKETFLYYGCLAKVDKKEFSDALETGWFPIDSDYWFQCRSTRINLEKYETKKEILKKTKLITYRIWKPDINLIKPIYEKYLKYKNFNYNNLTLEDIVKNASNLILYYYENKLIGFLAYKIINKSFLSIEFAWDYEKPSLSLGHVSRHVESIIAKQKKCKYIYMSAGYETCSLYKSHYPGFEWWKGFDWSSDSEHFRKLCYTDSKISVENFKISSLENL